jgi:hypothetical protein
MNLNDLFKKVKKAFTVQRVVDMDEFDLHMVLEPLTSAEEIKVLESCTGFDGGAFVAQLKRGSLAYSIKKINDIDFYDEVLEYVDDEGNSLKETKYIFITRQIDKMPSALRDALFEAFTNMQYEVEALVSKNVKFERFTTQNIQEEMASQEVGVPKGFRKIDKPADEEPVNETERLNQQVSKEAEQVEMGMSETFNNAK